MKYFKNTELAKLYGVSEKSVRNWIEAAQQNKIDLVLQAVGNRTCIADTSKNIATIEQLVKDRRKYRNTRGFKTVTPQPEFYKLYNQKQLFDIVSSLDIYREIPRQYNYFDGGANYWDKYANRLAAETHPNVLTSTLKLLDMNQNALDDIVSSYKRVNVVDIGVGNALPVKRFLAHLLKRGVLGRYVALDISDKMLDIAKNNIQQWFDGRVAFEGHVLDVNYERFTDVLATEYLGENARNTVNLILVLGGTLGNLRSQDAALQAIHDSMGRNDLFMHSMKLDTAASRRYFDFNIEAGVSSLAPNHRFIFDLLNIDPSLYDVEMGFDEKQKERYIRIRLKVALAITFKFDQGDRTVEFNKDDAILLWRYWHQSAMDVINQFDQNGFDVMQAAQTKDREYLLTISQIKAIRTSAN